MKTQQKKGGKTRARALSREQMRHKLFLMKRQDKGLPHVLQRRHLKVSVDFTPLLLNSARYIVLFQNLVVLWKIRMSQNIILPSDISRQDVLNGIRVAYVNFYDMWVLRQG
jgi:hypothetical protein